MIKELISKVYNEINKNNDFSETICEKVTDLKLKYAKER